MQYLRAFLGPTESPSQECVPLDALGKHLPQALQTRLELGDIHAT